MAYPIAKITINNNNNTKMYEIERLGVGRNGFGAQIYYAGSIECCLQAAINSVELMLKGYDIEGFRPGKQEYDWVLCGVHESDDESLKAIYIIKESDTPVAFYQGGKWFLPTT